MKKIIILLFISAPFWGATQSNAVKLDLNLPRLVLSNSIGFTYERKLSDKLSGSVSLNFSNKKAAPLSGTLTDYAVQYLDSTSVNTNIFKNKFSSFGLDFQLKFYPKKEALKGFYIAPYFGYQKGGMDLFDFEFPDKDLVGVTHGGEVDLGYKTFGGGIGIGNQWIIGKSITLDILWVGIGYGTTTISVQGTERAGETVDFQSIDADVNDFISKQNDQTVKRFTDNIKSEYTDDFIKLSLKQGIPFSKILNISIGYAF